MPLRVYLVDDNPEVCEKLKEFLAQSSDVTIVGIAQSGEAALVEIPSISPDVVLLDDNLPDVKSYEIVDLLVQKNVPVVITSTSKSSEHVLALLDVGIRGYILKTELYEKIVDVVQAVTRGVTWFSPDLEGALPDCNEAPAKPPHRPRLSPREQHVLTCLALGYDNAKIAEHMHIAPRTVRHYLRQLYVKLGMSRGELIVWAVQQGYGSARNHS